MRAQDIMTRPVICVSPDATVRHAAALLAKNGFASMPVVDAEEQLVGMVSEADVIEHGLHLGRRADAGTVAGVMTAPATAVSPDMAVADLAKLMVEQRLRCVPVVFDGTLVGVVARRDIMRILVNDTDILVAQVRYRLADYWGPGRRWDIDADGGVVTITGDFANEAERRVTEALADIIPGVFRVEIRTRGAATVA